MKLVIHSDNEFFFAYFSPYRFIKQLYQTDNFLMNTKPIGIFDSGVGGLSIWKEIIELLPMENTIYLADSKNAPYGNKSKEEILRLCKKNTEKLIQLGCKIIVVACNTATTNAINLLRASYDIPFIGIEPAIKPAALQTQSKIIGILATQGTLNSSLFAETSKKHMEGIKIIETVGKGLVPLIEENRINTPEMRDLLKEYISPMISEKIDHLVLGCSHYPFLIPEIKKITGNSISIIDSGRAVAKQTKAILASEQHLNDQISSKSSHIIYSNIKSNTARALIGDYKNVTITFDPF